MNSRLVVVSHACVLASNQAVFSQLEADFDVTLVVPARWRDELRGESYGPQRHHAFRGDVAAVGVFGEGRPQRHLPLVRPVSFLRQRNTGFLIVEEEPFSVAAAVWCAAARRMRVPYAVQVAENRPRAWPALVRASTARVLAGCSFVLARSPAALDRAREWGYTGPGTVVPHGVEITATTSRDYPRGVVGFVGRVVTAKGVEDLVAALAVEPDLTVRVAGDGPQRDAFAALGQRASLLGTVTPEQMNSFYEEISVLAVPSRTTSTWSEQFGRVIVEAQARATPVVAYDSGEIPWVAASTAAITVPEGDVAALRRQLVRFATDPYVARTTGEEGRERVASLFANEAVAEQLRRLITSANSRH